MKGEETMMITRELAVNIIYSSLAQCEQYRKTIECYFLDKYGDGFEYENNLALKPLLSELDNEQIEYLLLKIN